MPSLSERKDELLALASAARVCHARLNYLLTKHRDNPHHISVINAKHSRDQAVRDMLEYDPEKE